MFKFLRNALSDESLMLRFSQGDSDAFETLYLRHKDALFSFLYRSSGSRQSNEEIAQETWYAVIKSAAKYQSTAKFRTYLYALAHRKLVDHWRSNQTERMIAGFPAGKIDDQLVDEDPLEQLPGRETADSMALSLDLLDALTSLSREQQQAFLLKEEGFSRAEIAVMTGANEETIKSRIRYASRHLKQLLGVQYAEE